MKTLSSGEVQSVKPLARPERVITSSLRHAIRAILYALLLLLAWSSTLAFYSSASHVTVVIGEPSPGDIKAPRKLTYISEIKTQEAQLAEAAKVKEVYSDPDMKIADDQLRRLREITDYITALRHDDYADHETKLALIHEIPNLNLPASVLTRIVDIDEDAWQAATTEMVRVLDAIMHEDIRGDQLIEKKRRVFLLTTHTLSEDQQAIVVNLTPNLIVPNRFYDQERTLAEREAAQRTVEPVTWTIHEGESILREGEIVTDLALEKLQVLGLLQSETKWHGRVADGLFSLILVFALGLYVARSQPLLLARPRRELLLVLTLMIAGAAARIMVPGRTLLPYFFPAAAISMLITILLDAQLAMVVSAVVAALVGYIASGSIELAVYTLVGGMVGGLSIWRMDQLGAFVRAAVHVALANMAVILAFRLQNQTYDAVGLLQLMLVGAINAAISSSLTFVAFSLIGRVFGITTSLQLLELARPTHPLFRQLLIEAPGTYHHSIVISNMAERAAAAIGADALLARVGSYYHDIGKVIRPYFFSENQADGSNPHDQLDPKTSAEIIVSHTTDGLGLARKHRIPDKICDFIPEHHGTTLVTYFYRRANQESTNGDDVREEDFRYRGPKPQSKETAIVMLADSIEAWVRANRPSTLADMERVIRQVINDRLVSGQLDESDLTLKDLDHIREAFISVLQGIFHPRIQYPEKIQRKGAT